MKNYDLMILLKRKENLTSKLNKVDLEIKKIINEKKDEGVKHYKIEEIITKGFRKICGYDNYFINKFGDVFSISSNKILKTHKNKSGYVLVGLWKNGHSKDYLIHRLVAHTFLPNPNNLPEVNHKDFNIDNNSVENLEWCSREYNLQYSFNAGRMDNYFKRKQVKQFDTNGNLIKTWDGLRQAAKQLKINRNNIAECCKGKRLSYKDFIWKYE